MKNQTDRLVVCPFYSQEEGTKLHCEGFCTGTRILLHFDCKDRKKAHKKKYCKNINGYELCPLNPVIMKQYKAEEKEDE